MLKKKRMTERDCALVMDKTLCIVFVQRWHNQGLMQTIAEEKRERAS